MTVPTITRIGQLGVDLDALRRLAHECDPMTCRHTRCCCKSYEVMVERNEISRVAGSVVDAARFAPNLLEDGEPIDPIDETEGGHCLNTDEQGVCVFAYHTRQGAVRCSLHSLALEWGLPPAKVKPKACTIWPLALHGSSPMVLSVQSDAFTYPCNKKRNPSAATLHKGVAEIVEAMFGKHFLDRLQAEMVAHSAS